MDATRRMNQRVMAEVGEQFGANGVEIDAHMLCAEDHLPYQGQQFTNEEFEQIQDSLDRPFGEWNCRHTWAPIIGGVSPRAYTDEDVERFARFSTEEIEIDGTTKTRYEWSQAMRRMETAIREKKDTATLAEAAGDQVLRRDCQSSINAMVKEYERISDRTGMGPDFRRTYVGGFKDVKVETDTQSEYSKYNSLADFEKQIGDLREQRRRMMESEVYDAAKSQSLLDKILHLQNMRETWRNADLLAAGDKTIRRELLSNNPVKVMQGVEKALNGDRFGLPDSKWSGKAEIKDPSVMRGAAGSVLDSTKGIWFQKKYLHEYTVAIHEDLHLRSIHLYDSAVDRQWVRMNIKGYEEGVVQLRAETICEKVGIKPLKAYSEYTEALRVLHQTFEPQKSEYDFAKDLFDKSPITRYNVCEQMAQELKDKHPRKWNRIENDVTRALTTLRMRKP